LLNKNQNSIKNKKIVFKIPEFPHVSETFLVAQIVTAINLGYNIKIITRKLISNNISLIEKYQLLDKVIIEDYKIPSKKFDRALKWILLLIINFKDVYYVIKYYREHPKFSLSWLYQWVFYKQFNNVSIFHVQYGTNSKPLDILKKTGFKPAVIVTFHGHDAFFPINGFIPNNGYYDNLFKYGNLITVNTPYLADKIIELGCPKDILSIIPVGVDIGFFYPNTEVKKNHKALKLITVGRLDKVKGHHFCVEAVHQLINKGTDVTLTIIGDGSERESIETLIAKYQLGEKVFMEGKKSQREVRQALWEHDIYLLATVALSDGRRETQGLATLEAQACGLPVVVFDSGGVKYTLEDGISGFVCDEYDIDCMISKVKILVDDFDKYKQMSNEAVAFANKNFSQQLIDSKWKTIYSNLSNGK